MAAPAVGLRGGAKCNNVCHRLAMALAIVIYGGGSRVFSVRPSQHCVELRYRNSKKIALWPCPRRW